MKEYLKPEAETVSFGSEAIANLDTEYDENAGGGLD